MRMIPPPYKNKTIEFINLISLEERENRIKEAYFNTFLLRSRHVYIDFLTDSGTSAMSDRQWSKMMIGDEAYAGSESFYRLEEAVQKYFGYRYMVPAHQGRGAEHIMAKSLIKKRGQLVPNNMYFTTSRAHQEFAGGKWVDVSIPEAKDPDNNFLFKGNIDVEMLRDLIKKNGKKIAFVRIEASLNMAGGQPFSMENLRDVSRLCRKHDTYLLLDATRIVENAYFIKTRMLDYRQRSLKTIIREICDLTDGCTMSSKKDHFVNIGGFMATHDKKVFEKNKEWITPYEGLHTYGGLAGRDMEAVAQGIVESCEYESLVKHYLGQVAYLHDELKRAGIPVVEPSGAHAVFLDAKKFYPHIPQKQFPAQTLATEIYIEGGVRTMERGIVSGQHGKKPYNDLELVRVTIPRRVYELSHLMYVVDVIKEAYKRRSNVCGLKMIYEPPSLRFFQARFERI